MELRQPFFSVIIPTYNRPKELKACLQSLTCLNYPCDRFEVIVVDDGSETPVEDVVAPFRNSLDVTPLTQRNAGPAAARNTGASRAIGKLLVFTDDDCLPARDWLRALATRFATAPDRAVGGRTLNALPKNSYSSASQVLVDIVYDYFNSDLNHARFFATNNLALPADHFAALGGFDADLTTSEDREFCDRWLKHGYAMTYAPEVLVYHSHALTFRTFWCQHFNYGRGTYRFHERRIERQAGPFKLEPKFYLHILCYPFSHPQTQPSLLVAALLMITQGAKSAGFFWEMATRITGKINGCRQK
jgi:glycosyltransferase involved in cell wall biosynthesis